MENSFSIHLQLVHKERERAKYRKRRFHQKCHIRFHRPYFSISSPISTKLIGFNPFICRLLFQGLSTYQFRAVNSCENVKNHKISYDELFRGDKMVAKTPFHEMSIHWNLSKFICISYSLGIGIWVRVCACFSLCLTSRSQLLQIFSTIVSFMTENSMSVCVCFRIWGRERERESSLLYRASFWLD